MLGQYVKTAGCEHFRQPKAITFVLRLMRLYYTRGITVRLTAIVTALTE